MHKLNRHAFLYATTMLSPPDANGNPTNDEMVAKALELNKAQMQEFQLAVGVVEQLGRDLLKVLKRTRRLSWTTSAISATILADMMGFEAPHRLIEFFGDNPDRAKRLAVMSPGRRRAELARVEFQLVPDAATMSAPSRVGCAKQKAEPSRWTSTIRELRIWTLNGRSRSVFTQTRRSTARNLDATQNKRSGNRDPKMTVPPTGRSVRPGTLQSNNRSHPIGRPPAASARSPRARVAASGRPAMSEITSAASTATRSPAAKLIATRMIYVNSRSNQPSTGRSG